MDFNKIQPINKNLLSNDPLNWDALFDITNRQITDYNKKREFQVLNALKKAGYIVKDSEFHHFLKTRCSMGHSLNNKTSIFVDNVLFLEWWDTSEIEVNETEDGVVFTAVFGKPNDKPLAGDD